QSTTGCGTGATNGASPGCPGSATAGTGRRRRTCTRPRTSSPNSTRGSTGSSSATGRFSSPIWTASARPTNRPRSTPVRSGRGASPTSAAAAAASPANARGRHKVIAGKCTGKPTRSTGHVGYPAPPRARAGPSRGGSALANSVISGTQVTKLPGNPVRWILADLRPGYARFRMPWLGAGPPRRAGGRHDPCGDIPVTVAPAPAQDVSRVLAAPPVDDLRGHLEVRAVLTAVPDQRSQIIDQLGRRVITHMCRAGQRFVIGGPAGSDRPGQTRGGRTPPFPEICVNSWNIRRAGARGE